MVVFPDGSRVRASSIVERDGNDPECTFGLYLEARWEPTWPAEIIVWRDFGLAEDAALRARVNAPRSGVPLSRAAAVARV
jgi:hypothetical protein